MNKKSTKITFPMLIAAILLTAGKYVYNEYLNKPLEKKRQNTVDWANTSVDFEFHGNAINIPAYTGGDLPYVVNDNQPYFLQNEDLINTTTYITFSDLDAMGRTGEANCIAGPETMQTHDRGSISNIHPSGWYEAKASDINMNRSHEIGNAIYGDVTDCTENMITGTRLLNAGGERGGVTYNGMLTYEKQILNYMEDTGNHVRYRVTPLFDGNDVTAKGILMEAYSIEDQGTGLEFCVYIYNVDPDYECDYTTGEWNKITDPQLTTTEEADE